jgi:hypothetical protein
MMRDTVTQMGASEFLSKPVDAGALYETINRVTGVKL